ncbi:AIPR family protein [Aristaeella lactis]|uniref:AIPR protein n=1 Tax=Aristaeella lactis TaxID=3046383 RepID=A0AC61PN71_9FIRM|nr:AIPR family protein [Aristaeella lactis]QUA52730.1 AIPR family protein [Aristaeella lactis]SMC72626.1 AIPR protein [Aristaeella lactis]
MAKKGSLSNNQLLLTECIEQEFKESSGFASIDLFFEHFAISELLKNYGLTDDEVDGGIVGGGGDGGCDGFYLFLNEELILPDQIENLSAPRGSTLTLCIAQTKNEYRFKEDAIMKWKTISENLMNMSSSLTDFSKRYNEQIIDSFKMFRDVITKLIRNPIKLRIQYYYVTLGTDVHPNVVQQADELKAIAKRCYPSAIVDVSFIGADALMDMYTTDTEIRTELELAYQPISLSKKEYVVLVNLGTYYKFITDNSNNLRKSFFEANVRDYQGKNSVNSSIADTLEHCITEDFWWFNNGVTILASEITLMTTTSLQLVNPEIVNGLQTSREIYNYFYDNPAKLEEEKRHLLVRIIMPESEESRDNIIFATNNQTNIPKSSLRVTDPIHLQIEMYFKSRGLYYDRRKNYYKNQKKKANDIIGVSFLAQCLISLILRKPDFARARPSTLLTDEDTYKMLYEDNHDLEVFYKAAKIGQMVRSNLRLCADLTSPEKNDILFYLIYSVVAKRLGKKSITFEDIKSFDINTLSTEEIDEMRDLIYTKYKELGGNGQVVKDNTFVGIVDSLIGI